MRKATIRNDALFLVFEESQAIVSTPLDTIIFFLFTIGFVDSIPQFFQHTVFVSLLFFKGIVIMAAVNGIIHNFLQNNPHELVDGKLKVCVGGGAGFIGSHIAKKLREEVCLVEKYHSCVFKEHLFQLRVAMWYVRIGRRTNS